jgi:hypothetical protein
MILVLFALVHVHEPIGGFICVSYVEPALVEQAAVEVIEHSTITCFRMLNSSGTMTKARPLC